MASAADLADGRHRKMFGGRAASIGLGGRSFSSFSPSAKPLISLSLSLSLSKTTELGPERRFSGTSTYAAHWQGLLWKLLPSPDSRPPPWSCPAPRVNIWGDPQFTTEWDKLPMIILWPGILINMINTARLTALWKPHREEQLNNLLLRDAEGNLKSVSRHAFS